MVETGTVPPDTGRATFPSLLSTGRGWEAECGAAGSKWKGSSPLAILLWLAAGHWPCRTKVTSGSRQGSLGEQSPQASVTPGLDSYLRDKCISNETLLRSGALFLGTPPESVRLLS